MAEPLRIRIRSDWDAVLTYDVLSEPSGDRPVFVGRESLIEPLVAEVVEPNKRGTYLISGYRGTGKTTLLIEALSRAKDQLASRGHRLFPLVLNVSEVAASLRTADIGVVEPLDIDPRRLLIALLRTIEHNVRGISRDLRFLDLAEQARRAYHKATAAKFAQTSARAEETTRARSRELAIAFEDKNALKLVAAAAGAGAVALEATALVAPVMGWVHGLAAGLGTIFLVGVAASLRLSSSRKQTLTDQISTEHDNSLQQLETDLKDLLTELKRLGLRTVVVMEELDKIDDPKGRQLDAVIRYFKNLFTQAPALFFFITDKSYFDTIASAIKRARRGRSYAIEHTFFTHRLFVGRPTTRESLDFLEKVMLDDRDRDALKGAAAALGKPGRIHEADLFGRFIRVVLFRAANHLFDLKNELRRFVRNSEETVAGVARPVSAFVVDEQRLPPEEAALAVFQDLIVEKALAFEIKGGRAYANETLADSLYAVFNELGSSKPQPVRSFLPLEHGDDGLLLDEQLDLNEAARVRDAVRSLIGDLERGRAFASRDLDADTFTWREDAARAFRYVRQLEKHEETLIAELQRSAALVTALDAGTEPAAQHPMVAQVETRVSELRDSREPLSADAAAEELRQIAHAYAGAVTEAFSGLLAKLSLDYGFQFTPIARGVTGSLHFAMPNWGDPRLNPSAPRGGVLVALGEMETLAEDVLSFVTPESAPSLHPLDRVALVHVLHGATVEERTQRRVQWLEALSRRFNPPLPVAVDVMSFSAEPEEALTTAQRLGAVLAAFGAWSRSHERALMSVAADTPPLENDLRAWIDSPENLLHIQTAPAPSWRFLYERDAIEADGRVLLAPTFPPTEGAVARVFSECQMAGFKQTQGTPEDLAQLGGWLLASGRVILYFDVQAMGAWSVEDVRSTIEAGGKVIVASAGSLPPVLDELPHVTISATGEPAAI